LENIRISKDIVKTSSDYFIPFDGIIKYLQTVMDSDESSTGKKWADQFLATTTCNICDGMRLKKESLFYRIADKNIAEVFEKVNIKDLFFLLYVFATSFVLSQQ